MLARGVDGHKKKPRLEAGLSQGEKSACPRTRERIAAERLARFGERGECVFEIGGFRKEKPVVWTKMTDAGQKASAE
jgi:hypothetical protein